MRDKDHFGCVSKNYSVVDVVEEPIKFGCNEGAPAFSHLSLRQFRFAFSTEHRVSLCFAWRFLSAKDVPLYHPF